MVSAVCLSIFFRIDGVKDVFNSAKKSKSVE